MKILMVEDNAMNRDMLTRRLTRLGYEVVVARDGESGIALAQSENPGLIIMDLSLPGVDGWESTRLLRTLPATKSVPIIALTAHAVGSDRAKALAMGCNDYDTKPVDIDRLAGKIARLIGPDNVPTRIPIVPDPKRAMPATPPSTDSQPNERSTPLPARDGLGVGSVAQTSPQSSERSSPLSSREVLGIGSGTGIVKEHQEAGSGPGVVADVVTILLVEDNELNRDMLSRRLQRVGYTLLVAVDGEEGLRMATGETSPTSSAQTHGAQSNAPSLREGHEGGTPDLILMDMSLPALDGWEATRLLKSRPEARHIPIIALTAHAMTSDYEKCMAAGCDDYDTKPVEFKRLLGKIEAQLVRVGIKPPKKQ